MMPPRIGPPAIAVPMLAPQKENARVRSVPLKRCVRIASEAVKSSAPPTPWAARDRLSIAAEVAKPQASEETPKMARPMTIASRRP